MGQKDPEKLYWERNLEVLVAGMCIRGTQYAANRTNTRHTGKHSGWAILLGLFL